VADNGGDACRTSGDGGTGLPAIAATLTRRWIMLAALSGLGSSSTASRVETLAPIPTDWVVFANAQSRQDGADAIDDAYPICNEFCALPHTTAGVFIGLGRDRNHRAHTGFTPQPRQQRPQQEFGVNPIRLGSTRPAIDRDAGRLNDVRLDAVFRQPSGQPKT
jgi:hypothetical protein